MSQPIHQMFSSDESAAAAANALLEYGFLEVHVCPPVGAGGLPAGRSAPLDDIVAELMRQYVLKWRAKILAPRIQAGGTVVTVHAPFGSADAALGILAEFQPIDNGLPDTSTPALRWDDAAPMSSALQMPVLMHGPTAFSTFWSLPALLSRARTTSAALGLTELKDSSGPYKSLLGLNLLSDKATILSSMLGLPVLKRKS